MRCERRSRNTPRRKPESVRFAASSQIGPQVAREESDNSDDDDDAQQKAQHRDVKHERTNGDEGNGDDNDESSERNSAERPES